MKKIRITPTILQEVSAAIEDALRHQGSGDADSTDPTYLKIDAAANARTKGGPFTIDADEDDLRELKSRAEYDLDVCDENIADSYRFEDRAYWLGRKRAYKALLNQIKA